MGERHPYKVDVTGSNPVDGIVYIGCSKNLIHDI
ncbi:hypothetical protein [Enterococcus phage PEF1]